MRLGFGGWVVIALGFCLGAWLMSGLWKHFRVLSVREEDVFDESFSTQACHGSVLGIGFGNEGGDLGDKDLGRGSGYLDFLFLGYWTNIQGPCELVDSVKEDTCKGFEIWVLSEDDGIEL